LGLRPRHTAELITVVTGMLITVVTLGVVLLVSDDARQALFHLQQLQQQTNALVRQIAQEQAQLRALQFRDVVYQNDQEVLRTVIDGQAPLPDIRRRVQTFLDLAAQSARQQGLAPGPDGVLVQIYPAGVTVESVSRDIAERSQPMVVRLIATENTVRGLPLRASLLVFPDSLIFHQGEPIAVARIDGRQSRQKIEDAMLALGSAVASEARRRGVISPPFALVSAPPDVRIDPAVFLQVLDRVQESRAVVDVGAVALGDAHTVGPVQLTFR
jgi:uncharacterized protein (DUF3084 family)